MRVLIDECLPSPVVRSFAPHGHECRTVREAGLASKKNGEPLSLADGEWDILLTNDKNVKYQQNVTGRRISIIVLIARSNRLSDLLPLIPECLQVLSSIRDGEIIEVGRTREDRL
jgi:predicted nuclease of predicted toxin-antitoxin system